MQHALVITFIAQDKPGVIDLLSQTVKNAGGNWLESRMTKLAGKFTGIIQVSIANEAQQALKDALLALANEQFALLIDDLETSVSINAKLLTLSIIGLDRPGIVQEFTKALAAKNLNIAKMHSVIESAPMSGDSLFKAEASIEAPDDLDFDTLDNEIEQIADKLDIEYTLAFNTP
jgi:glycine cleavage system regulatory protein